MPCYPVYLEVHADGRTMAHVPDLRGCVIRATSREEALRRLPEAIRHYHAWLRRHGEPAPTEDEPIQIEIVGESIGYGPFDPQNAAALLPPDRQPITVEEMERYCGLMAHARADLLALVADLPDEVLDWQPASDAWTIRRVLRHIGNAEEWYVSRLVPAETLPPEWEHDESLPIFEFLEMERRTAVARLRQWSKAIYRLTEFAETSKVSSEILYPQNWTDHPDEPWTARKVLRRFLEHEWEHIGQVREALAAWRTHFLAHLAIERVRFFEQLTGLDERTLAESPVFDDWTAKDLLAHVAAWDELFTERMRLVLAGRQGEIASVEPDERNPAIHAERRDWTLDQAVRACEQARAAALEVMAQASDEELHRQRQFPWGGASLRLWMQWRAEHDANHAADLARWRQGGQPQGIAPTNERQDNLSASTPTRTTTLRTPPNHRAASRQAAPDP